MEEGEEEGREEEMTDLKKRVFVLLNLRISTLGLKDKWETCGVLSRVKGVLEGARYDISIYYHKQHCVEELTKEVASIMYLTEISVEDMKQVLDDLMEHYK